MRLLPTDVPCGKIRWASLLTRERLAPSMIVLPVAVALLAAVPVESRDRTPSTVSSAKVIDPYVLEVTFNENTTPFTAPGDAVSITVYGTRYSLSIIQVKCRSEDGGICPDQRNAKWWWIVLRDPILSGGGVWLSHSETCTETGAIYTDDGRKLSVSVAIEIAFAPRLSVADDEETEGDDTVDDNGETFTLSLSSPTVAVQIVRRFFDDNPEWRAAGAFECTGEWMVRSEPTPSGVSSASSGGSPTHLFG